jgi:hypothetical protein
MNFCLCRDERSALSGKSVAREGTRCLGARNPGPFASACVALRCGQLTRRPNAMRLDNPGGCFLIADMKANRTVEF